MPSGYEADGTDLDSIFYINDASKSISAEYKVVGATSYGRYLERSSGNTADASQDTGYEINGVDLNRTYARKEDVRAVHILIRGGDGTADGYQNGGEGAHLAFVMYVQKGTTLTFEKIPGGAQNPKITGQHGWVGQNGAGGDAISCSIGQYYKDDGTFNDPTNIVAIAGGGGGAGGYSTNANKTHFRGGAGGNAGYGDYNQANTSSYNSNYKYWSGEDGEIRDLGSNGVDSIITASGGNDFNSTISRAQYRSHQGTHQGAYHTGSSKGTTSTAHGLGGDYRAHGGSGGAGWQGGQAGVIGTAGGGYETTALGGGGGSTAIRFQNFHDGIVDILNVTSAVHIGETGWNLYDASTVSARVTKQILATEGIVVQW